MSFERLERLYFLPKKSLTQSQINNFYSDLSLIWTNCWQYNEDGSDISKKAAELGKFTTNFIKKNILSDKKYSKIDDSDNIINNQYISTDDRNNLNLKKIEKTISLLEKKKDSELESKDKNSIKNDKQDFKTPLNKNNNKKGTKNVEDNSLEISSNKIDEDAIRKIKNAINGNNNSGGIINPQKECKLIDSADNNMETSNNLDIDQNNTNLPEKIFSDVIIQKITQEEILDSSNCKIVEKDITEYESELKSNEELNELKSKEENDIEVSCIENAHLQNFDEDEEKKIHFDESNKNDNLNKINNFACVPITEIFEENNNEIKEEEKNKFSEEIENQIKTTEIIEENVIEKEAENHVDIKLVENNDIQYHENIFQDNKIIEEKEDVCMKLEYEKINTDKIPNGNNSSFYDNTNSNYDINKLKNKIEEPLENLNDCKIKDEEISDNKKNKKIVQDSKQKCISLQEDIFSFMNRVNTNNNGNNNKQKVDVFSGNYKRERKQVNYKDNTKVNIIAGHNKSILNMNNNSSVNSEKIENSKIQKKHENDYQEFQEENINKTFLSNNKKEKKK